jgi:hypothetical protein
MLVQMRLSKHEERELIEINDGYKIGVMLV